MKTYNSILELVGNTPLVKLNNIMEAFNLKANLYAKVEAFNPGGSVKDRAALQMIEDLEAQGVINQDTLLIEPTSGNTGIGLAFIANFKGYNLTIVMPDSMSKERIDFMKSYGAHVILTPGINGMNGAIKKAKEIQAENPGSIIVGQFVNESNPKAHYLHTAPEIYEALDGKVDALVAGIGTGGTITGVGRYFKEQNENIRVIGVEPESSPILTKGYAGKHVIQGIGAGFIPEVLDKDILDEVIDVPNESALKTTLLLSRAESILAGISSGAALYAAITVAKRDEFKGKNIVVVFPDSGDRYISSGVYIEKEEEES